MTSLTWTSNSAVSPHQNYFLWGPRDYTGESVIVIDSDRGGLDDDFASVAEVARRHHPYAMPEENGPVFHCRGLKVPIREIEARAGLDFGGLAEVDPLAADEEAVGGGPRQPLTGLEQIRFS